MSKHQKKVLKQYPNAYVEYGMGGLRIMSGDVHLAEEFYMPKTSDENVAWEYAAMSCRLTQNFNRAHPNRMSLTDVEGRLDRIHKRKRRGRNAKRDAKQN
tara:strand:- start:1292 stop:1591 length:300 start_codon:yes stop_codon:yes gene_type:complete